MGRRVLVSVLALLLAGCSHQLQLRNAHQYSTSMPYIESDIQLGVVAPATQIEEQFVSYIVDGLIGLANTKVLYPYKPNPDKPVDYVVDFQVRVNRSGSGTNFVVSWPGYLIFAPAWNGFVYYASINTKVTVTDFETGDVVAANSYDTKYRCNQAEFDRTFIEISWFEYGVIAFIGGIINISYDDDITPEFDQAISQPYGSYISRKVGKVLQNI